MEIYDYYCSGCGRKFKKMVLGAEPEVHPACPFCQGRETEQQAWPVSPAIANIGAAPAAESSCGSHNRFR